MITNNTHLLSPIENHRSMSFSYTYFLKVFFVFITLFALSGCTTQQPIINGVDERDANEIVVLLESKGIGADKQPAATSAGGGGGKAQAMLWNILVDASQATEAMGILNSVGLPRRPGQNLLDLFAEPGLVPTEMQQKIRYQAGLAQQIANTIQQIDGVLDANVQLSFPPDDSKQPITASVYVKHNGVLDNPNSQLVTKIKQLVAGSVSGLSIDNVTVVADRARFTDVTLNQGTPSAANSEQEYVKVWSVVVAKNSVGTFRAIFFTMCLIIFFLVCVLAWVFWKCYPIINRAGGIPALWKDVKPINHLTKEGELSPKESDDKQVPPPKK